PAPPAFEERGSGGGAPEGVRGGAPVSGRGGVGESPAGPTIPDPHAPAAPDPAPPTRRVPLGTIVGARSGDKGGDANVGVWAESAPAWEWLHHTLTVDAFKELLPETAPLEVTRHALPNLRSLNFTITRILGAGVASGHRFDPQAKALGEWLRSRHVDIPTALLQPPAEPPAALPGPPVEPSAAPPGPPAVHPAAPLQPPAQGPVAQASPPAQPPVPTTAPEGTP
ncbi:hypothetical protein ACFWNV_38970, partial [Streptomyces sp. NPDC058401]